MVKNWISICDCQALLLCGLLPGILARIIEMDTFTADPSLQQSLAKLAGLTEVRDSAGTILGYFSPATHQSAEAYAQAAAHFDPDEKNRRKLSTEKGRPTNEVLSRMQRS